MRAKQYAPFYWYLSIALLGSLLTACGGGGGGGGGSTSSAPSSGTPVASGPQPAIVPTNPVLPSGPPAGAACPTTNSNVAVNGGTQLAIGASRASGVAPLSVFFDASGTTSSATARPFHEIEYRWNFGEAGSGTWNYGAKAGTASRNGAMGPVAAHVFESAGTFPITVTAFDGTNTATYSCNITVLNTDAEFAGNKTVCVSGTGNFAGCPAGALHVTNSNPSTAVSGNIGSGNKRILFHRGETFNVGATIQVNKNGPGIIGAFGTGAKPVLINTAAIATFSVSSMATPAMSDWRLMDLKIEGSGFEGNSTGISGAGSISHLLISRLDIQNLNTGIKFSGSNLDAINNSVFTSPMWDGLFIVDSTVYNLTGTGSTGGNGFYLTGWRMAVMGNSIDNNLGGEHGMRSAYSDRSVWQHNTTRRVARAHMTLRAGGQGGSTLSHQIPGLVYTQKLLASENHFIGGAEAHAFGGTGPTNAISNGRAREQIWEKNLMVGGAGTNGFIGVTGSEITVRNNLILLDAACGWSPLNVGPYDTAYALSQGIPQPTNIWFYHNTVYHPSSTFFKVTMLIGDVLTNSELTFKNNLMYAPNNAIAQDGGDWIYNPNNTTVYRTPLNSSTLAAEINTSPRYTVNPPSAAAHLKPLTGSYAIGRATSAPVWSDYFGNAFPQGARDIGAVAH